MRIKTEFPHAVREIEHTWIPLSDGCRLAARIWLPADAEDHPVPAILEYIPYRKNDWMAASDAERHPYFAGHGYASVRVDLRGSGDSDGILLDEYLRQEQDDALEVLSWLAAQPWCTGNVGMMGISWGGFNSLQVAARRPRELKTIITVCSTADRYADDIHHIGGCVLACGMLSWASAMLAFNARPPDPNVVGERWREMWLDRLKHTPPFIEAWLSHQRRDTYWKQGSPCEDYAAIACPVYAVGGWADPYAHAVLNMLAGLKVPRKGLIGPWAHVYPYKGVPGPAIGFLQECLRWWDYWLKGVETGIMDEPMLRVWMQKSIEPRPCYAVRPGRWVAESSWPPSQITPRRYALNAGTLDEAPAVETRIEYLGLQTTGLDAGAWWGYGSSGEVASDQRSEDGRSLSFTSAPLNAPMELLGFPEVTLTLASDRPSALVAVRLCDVAPTGTSTLITRGILNLTHRDSDEEPTPLLPGRRYSVTVRLRACAWTLTAGHRLRVGVSPTYWPWTWPSPEAVTLSLFTGAGCRLDLPVRAPRKEDEELQPFEEPEIAPPLAVQVLRQLPGGPIVRQDRATGRVDLIHEKDLGRSYRIVRNGIENVEWNRETYSIVEGDALSALVRCESTIAIGSNDWRTRIETSSMMSADAKAFHVTNVLDAYEGNTRIFTETWTITVPRDLV